MARRKSRKVGSSWKAMRKVGNRRRAVIVKKISRTKYKVREVV